MRKLLIVLLLAMGFSIVSVRPANAQVTELTQLALNIEKLAQFKKILSTMYSGYQILTKGYNTIRDIGQGNFNMHDAFLNELLGVSPGVKKYRRIAEIIQDEVTLIKETKASIKYLKQRGGLNIKELDYFSAVYGRVLESSLTNIDELTMIITANKLRMSDDERIEGINNVYKKMKEQLGFVRSFHEHAVLLSLSRTNEQRDTETLKNLHGIK